MRSLALWLLLTSLPVAGRASEPRSAVFALITGVNRSVDRDLGRLQYADDDAARYFDLFRTLGARTYLLTSPDDNTRRLHSQAVAEALAPRRKWLDQVASQLVKDITRARQRGLETLLYFVYAGHGNIRNGRGYITLEDARLDSTALRDLFARLGADQTHLIVDACHSYFLAHSRGPGGRRRQLHGFSQIKEAFASDRIGLLLSTTTARESHEWEAFQAGVFSHEVRSGLYGAADADGDGRVSYREIAAFVSRANAAIPNERFRPRVFARPPKKSAILLDLRSRGQRVLQIDGARSSRYLLEDSRGVRLADFHNAPGQAMQLVRPASRGLLYLRSLETQREYAIPASPDRVALAALDPAQPRARPRGAAHHAFSLVFSLPFSRRVVSTFKLQLQLQIDGQADQQDPPGQSRWRRILAWSAVGLAGAALTAGVVLSVSAHEETSGVAPDDPHSEVVLRNDRIDTYNTAAVTMYAVAGAAAVTGLLSLLWPEPSPSESSLSLVPGGSSIALVGRF